MLVTDEEETSQLNEEIMASGMLAEAFEAANVRKGVLEITREDGAFTLSAPLAEALLEEINELRAALEMSLGFLEKMKNEDAVVHNVHEYLVGSLTAERC
jgi:hypothetical protein